MKTLNLPKTKLETADVVMLVGIGGGYDVFTGLPFVEALLSKRFVLVNSSPKNDFLWRHSGEEDEPEINIGFKYNTKSCITVGRHGVASVRKAYQEIINRYQVDTILAIDGGVDSLARGDEENSGTILEDFIAMAALDDVVLTPHGHCGHGDKNCKILCCAGFGTETEESLNHYRILENMSDLTAKGAFIGSFSLTQDMKEFANYAEVCELAWNNKRKSHIQTKIISSARGRFNNQNMYDHIDARVAGDSGVTFLSLLSSIYWLFDFDAVVQRNLAIPSLKKSNTFADAKILLKQFLAGRHLRDKRSLPL